MSSAIASLKKTKKNQLLSSVPFRNPTPTSCDVKVDDMLLLEDVTSHMAATRLKDLHSQSVVNVSQKPAAKRINPDSKNSPSDHELMMLMTSRITNLETRLQFQSQELAEREKKIRILEEKLRVLQGSRGDGSSESLLQLEKKCLLQQEQIYEMEAFLEDYGMVWVGDKSNPESSFYLDNKDEAGDAGEGLVDPRTPQVWKPTESLPSGNFSLNYNQFVRNVNELNILAGEGIAKIQHTPDGARLKMPDPVQLTLYSNGLLMFSGPFRPFSDTKTQELVRDIMDGYFPSELQGRFPEGVPFKFTDKHDVIFKDKNSELFQGKGQILGGENNRSCLIPSSASRESRSSHNKPDVAIETEIPGPKLTMEQFLCRIPKSVIKNGKVIDIRNAVQDTMTGNDAKTGTVTVVNTQHLCELKGRLELSEAERPPSSSRQITTLRIKSELGDQTYILKMQFTETVGDLRKYLNKERGSNSNDYKIMSAFPKTVFEDEKATLQECGLTPNATLHLTRN